MPQLGNETIADAITAFSNGRLNGGDEEIVRMIDAALLMARRYAGWHVCPVIEGDSITLDGPDSRMLSVPSRKLVNLNGITEDGNTVDLTTLRIAAGGPPGLLERPVTIRKKSGSYWSGDYDAITVDLDHGYTEDEAADWLQAILQMVDQLSLVPVSGGTGFSSAGLTVKRVDDVSYTWGNAFSVMAENVLFSVEHILCDYQLPRVEFM